MQNTRNYSCKNCSERGKDCDGAEPICNLCIRDGLLCSGSEPLIRALPHASLSWEPPESSHIFDEPLANTSGLLQRAISTIVSTPAWGSSYGNSHGFDSHGSLSTVYPTTLRTLSLDPRIDSNTLPFILGQYIRFLDKIAFRMPPPEVREGIMLRLRGSAIMFSVMSLGARIFQAALDNFDNTNWPIYANLVDKLYSRICVASKTVNDHSYLEGRLSGTIELASFKFMTADNATGYELVRKETPTLLRLAYQYPELWSKRGMISLSQVMLCEKYEIFSFTWTDNIAAMVLGTPTFLPYDTTTLTNRSKFQTEWMWGCPEVFIIQCARINRSRSLRGEYSDQRRWKGIEKELVEWEPVSESSNDSRDTVARLAVQESWRHAMLIYLYMAICGVNSSDPRVDASVNQITKLVKTVKHTDSFDRHLFVPCLIVGACARSESQRALVETKLSSMKAMKIWVLRSADFTAVLEHLWHGAAKDGRATTWNDYIQSRRAILPVSEGNTPVF